MEFKTGDWAMMVSKDPSFVQRTIRKTTGSYHSHDELIVIGRDGKPYCGFANPPRFKLVPLAERVAAAKNGTLQMAVFRYSEFLLPGHAHSEYYERWQECMSATVRTMALFALPYDVLGVLSVLRNRIRNTFPIMRPIFRHKEHAVYCTESCVYAYRINGIEILGAIGQQPLPSPIHAERLVYAGVLKPIADFGLLDNVQKNPNLRPKIKG